MVTSAGHFISLTNFYSFSFFVLELLRYTELRVRREFEWAHTPFFFPDPIWTRNWVWPPPITPFVDLIKTKNPVREVEAVLFFFFFKFTLGFLFCFADYGRRWWCCRFCHRLGGRNCALCYYILSALQPRSKNTYQHEFFLFLFFIFKEICGLGLSRLVEPTQQDYISCYDI